MIKYVYDFFAFCSLTKPADFTECVGDELPIGWEQAYDYQRGIYYVDHINSEYCEKKSSNFYVKLKYLKKCHFRTDSRHRSEVRMEIFTRGNVEVIFGIR